MHQQLLTPARQLLLASSICALLALFAGSLSRLTILFLLLLLVPGYLLERALGLPRQPLLLRLALWLAFSLSLIVLLYQWCSLLGLTLTRDPLLWLITLTTIAAAICAWQEAGWRVAQPATDLPRLQRAIPWLLFGLICLLTLWTRFSQIEGLALPAWVDSVHHALMIRVAAEQGRIPTSLAPYMPVEALPYHWGYHVFAAALMLLGETTIPQTMLWSGQLLNALHAPLAGALALALWRRPMAAVGAALVAGLLSIMPAYYLSWGRYTQLTGLLLIPALLICWQALLNKTSGRWLLASAIVLSGLCLIHMRVLFFSLALLGSVSVVWALDQRWPALRAGLIRGGGAALCALGLAAPWLSMLAQRALFPAFQQPGNLVMEDSYNSINLSVLYAGQNRLLIALAALAVFQAIWKRSRPGVSLLFWVAGLLCMANPNALSLLFPSLGLPLLLWSIRQRRWWLLPIALLCCAINPWMLKIPTIWLINNDAVIISLFLPMSALIGGAVADVIQHAQRSRFARFARPAMLALLLLAMGWGTWELRTVINPSTVLAEAADLEAIEWVQANTPADARFLINASSWLGVADRGVDGGWWLLPLAARWTSTPPVLFTYGPPAYVQETIARSHFIAAYQPGQEQQLFDIITKNKISYIYLGSKGGAITRALFANRADTQIVYEQNGITILAVATQP